MDEISAEVPEYMVAVKKEFLVLNKGACKKNSASTEKVQNDVETENKTASSLITNTDVEVSKIDYNVHEIPVGKTSEGDIAEGYKSNGYKIDDRDRQQSSNWNKPKDYTGGKDAHHNNSHGSKKRPRDKDSRPDSSDRLCSYVSRSVKCPWEGTCEYSHDPIDYLSRKVADIGPICYQFETFGECQNGVMCRFGSQHVDYTTGISSRRSVEDGGVIERVVINQLTKEVQSALRKKKYNFKSRVDTSSTVEKIVEIVPSVAKEEPASKMARLDDPLSLTVEASAAHTLASQPEAEAKAEADRTHEASSPSPSAVDESSIGKTDVDVSSQLPGVTAITSTLTESAESRVQAPQVPAKANSKGDYNLTAYPQKMKLVDFSNKVYIAPLTTVGNLPWRRVMKDFGADITCGEMAMSHNLVQGQASEWARIRRHASEDCFGIQVAGGQPEHISKIAKLLENETSSDFVDLNCGCPLDTICNRGCGAILLNKPKKLVEIVGAMTKALHSRQVTVKIRTGWDDKNPSAHKLIPMLQKTAKGRIAAIMIHGRSRLQRYSKLANWEYVLQAARSQDPNYPRIPIIGNGDIFCWDDWNGHCDKIQSDVTGGDNQDSDIIGLTSCAMLGRGALIKPWLPQELKEKRNIDISASERLEMLKKFVNYGLEHWGSDTQGVATTRSFLLEWLSFLHRYVPVALTERQQRMQQRPPHFFGRCDLETLMGSSNSNDWVRISEMLLGPVGDNFLFVAKHKSNSYATEVDESNG